MESECEQTIYKQYDTLGISTDAPLKLCQDVLITNTDGINMDGIDVQVNVNESDSNLQENKERSCEANLSSEIDNLKEIAQNNQEGPKTNDTLIEPTENSSDNIDKNNQEFNNSLEVNDKTREELPPDDIASEITGNFSPKDDISSEMCNELNDPEDTTNVDHIDNQSKIDKSTSDDDKPLSEVLRSMSGRKRKHDDAETNDNSEEVPIKKKECISDINGIYRYKCPWPGKGQCSHCKEMFYTRRNAKRHMNLKHARELMYECQHCLYRVRLKERLSRHIASVHKKESMYVNDFGIYKDAYIKNVETRNNLFYGANVYKKCPYCFYETTNDRMRVHITTLHQVKYKPHYCLYCSFTTDFLNKLQDHVSVHDHLKCYSCDHCVYRTMRISYLRRHVKNAHKNVDESFIDDNFTSIMENFSCMQCSFTSNEQKVLFKHIIHNHQKNWKLSVKKEETEDNSTNSNDSTLNQPESSHPHLLKSHPQTFEIQQKKFMCNKCNFITLYESLYNEHMASVHVKINDVQWFSCEYCEFTTIYAHSLKRHYETVHLKIKRNRVKNETPKERSFECGYCNLITLKKIQIRRHVENEHDIDRPYNCNVCDYKSSKPEELKRHMRLHS